MAGHLPVERAAARLHEARRVDHDIAEVDASLRQAEDSLRWNPRVREGALSRIVLRTGLDTLEICAVVLRVLSRTLTDLAKTAPTSRCSPTTSRRELEQLFGHVAQRHRELRGTDHHSGRRQRAERRGPARAGARRQRARSATAPPTCCSTGVQEHPRQWQLHGALLAEVDRILDELAVEKRSERLVEELDRYGKRAERALSAAGPAAPPDQRERRRAAHLGPGAGRLPPVLAGPRLKPGPVAAAPAAGAAGPVPAVPARSRGAAGAAADLRCPGPNRSRPRRRRRRSASVTLCQHIRKIMSRTTMDRMGRAQLHMLIPARFGFRKHPSPDPPTRHRGTL